MAPGAHGEIPKAAISDVDYRLIGLSPQYWSYTPLLIGDLIGLPLVNGVDCFVSPVSDATTETLCPDLEIEQEYHVVHTSNTSQIDSGGDGDEPHRELPLVSSQQERGDSQTWNIVPLSRVLIRGIVTAIDRRPFGCTMIVVDDGTGSIDCRYWDDSKSDECMFDLTQHDCRNKRRCSRFVIGDSLEVMGKIKVLTAGIARDQCNLSIHSTIPLEARFGCVREIHATSVCLIDEGQSRMANQWSGEVIHWMKCMDFSRKCSQSIIKVGNDFLPLLGERIFNSILSDGIGDFFSSEKAIESESNNVLSRKCCQTQNRIRMSFFYCHCEATLEALDPSFRYRDALLNRLLDMEAQLQFSSDSCFPGATEDCMDLFGAQSDTMHPPLLFTFESIYKDEVLSTIAIDEVSSTTVPSANAQRLVRRIFVAMTNDGILSLFDSEKDLYLLVSRNRVIEPYLRMSLACDEGSHIPPPFFIRCIPKKRIAEIMTWIKARQCNNKI